jgi:outer membrane protein assembly factor BamE (lipoprotein component of BamABCDE complex)
LVYDNCSRGRAPSEHSSGSRAVYRAQIASDAQTTMVGMTKEQVLACMGPPMTKAAEGGGTEAWSYASGDGTTHTIVSGGNGWLSGSSSQRYCTVNVTMVAGRVNRLNYVGPTGGLLTAGEQCAFALQNCRP